MEVRAGTTRHRRRRRGEGGAENEANRSLTKMQSNGCRNGASGEWAARRGSRKKSEAVGAPGCVEIVRAAYALFAIEKAEFVSVGGRPIRCSFGFPRFSTFFKSPFRQRLARHSRSSKQETKSSQVKQAKLACHCQVKNLRATKGPSQVKSSQVLNAHESIMPQRLKMT